MGQETSARRRFIGPGAEEADVVRLVDSAAKLEVALGECISGVFNGDMISDVGDSAMASVGYDMSAWEEHILPI